MAAQQLPNVKSWSINNAGENHAYMTSASGGHEQWLAGAKDWTAQIVIQMSNDGPDISEDASGTALTYAIGTSTTHNFYEDATYYWQGVGIVTGYSIDVNLEDGSEILVTYDVLCDGTELTRPSGGAAAARSSVNGKVTVGT